MLDVVQTVRRDNCRLVSSVIETCLHKMLIDRDVQGAEESVGCARSNPKHIFIRSFRRYTKQVIADLLQNKIDMSQLVITKALAKAGKHSQGNRHKICMLIRLTLPRLCGETGSRGAG